MQGCYSMQYWATSYIATKHHLGEGRYYGPQSDCSAKAARTSPSANVFISWLSEPIFHSSLVSDSTVQRGRWSVGMYNTWPNRHNLLTFSASFKHWTIVPSTLSLISELFTKFFRYILPIPKKYWFSHVHLQGSCFAAAQEHRPYCCSVNFSSDR